MTSAFLRGSSNFVWITTSVLGKGATGAVYQGVNKNNGEPVAVKTFNQASHQRSSEVQLREFEVIQRVKHENIVKLLAIEDEQDGRGKVIVMELCTGGSLFTILEDPENTYGLQEEEFLLVLSHLTAGMKHLRDNNLVHRDLKPGNIMKFIAEDGRTIYKLTDFGAARELQEDQKFVSLYGTEEYLHPDLFERAVLKKPVGTAFGATVDLWSIGVTLYHVATGNLPFRPYGGRRNKETMFFITTKKATGVISGIQLRDNGPIEWSKDLPSNSRLSAGLKRLVIPLLAGLMETDHKRVWKFDRFFSEVTDILSRKLLHIYHLNKSQTVRVYLHPEGTFAEVQSLIMEQTNVAPHKQILLLKDRPFLDVIDENTPGRGYPKIEEECPIMLLSKDNNNVVTASENPLPDFPKFPTLVSVENDASIAKVACSVGHECKRRIEKLAQTSRLNGLCVEVMSTVVSRDLERVLQRSENLQALSSYVRDVVNVACRSHNAIRELDSSSENPSNTVPTDWKTELNNLTKELTENLAPAIKQLHDRYVIEKTLLRKWTDSSRNVVCPSETRMPYVARTLVDRLRESWQHLLRDKATRSLTYNDEQFHVLERIKVVDAGQQLRSLLDQKSAPPLAQQAENMADCYIMAQTVFSQTQILEKDVTQYEQHLDRFKCIVVEADRVIHDRLLTKQLRGEAKKDKPSKSPFRSKEECLKFTKAIEEMINMKKGVHDTVLENRQLVNQIREITLNFQQGDSVSQLQDITLNLQPGDLVSP